MVQEIIGKAAKLSARHTHLLSLVVEQYAWAAETRGQLVEADRCVKGILALMDEMEGLYESKSPLFQRQQTEASSEP